MEIETANIDGREVPVSGTKDGLFYNLVDFGESAHKIDGDVPPIVSEVVKNHYERIAEHMRSLKFTKGFIQKHWDKYLPQQHEHISQEMAILDMQYEAGFKCLSV